MTNLDFDLSEKQILLIENNKMMRRLVRDMLVGFGVKIHNIVETDQVGEALEFVYHKSFDLVITDFFLGDLDGGDFTRHIRSDKDCMNRKIPILLITGSPNHEKVLKALESGIDELLAKPIAPSALYYRIIAMWNKPRPFVITPNYVGPSRSVQRLESIARLSKSRKAGVQQQWRNIEKASLQYPQTAAKVRVADPFLM